ncbi:MAG TPA: M15 family metallopeptidase [Hanamia sp.]|nr:M15 family metallopeptidase [Hanamia sp.]
MDLVYKIKYLQRFSLALFISNLVAFNLAAQSKIVNKYGLSVIGNIKVLQNEINNDSSLQMINLQKYIPGIDLDLKYATRDNFMHEKLYPHVHTTFLRKPAADALKKVVEDLKDQNLSLKIFDAYRPYSVTEKMWEKVKDDRYAADPSKGSGHNRGAAVDLTLINLKTKKELPMGTGFDNFTDSAHADFKDLPDSILSNRNLLKAVMEKYGFKQLTTEWWHFYLPNSSSFELLDISFADLKKMDKKSSNK